MTTNPSELLHGLPLIPQDSDGPVFQAPWQAAAFALAVRLSSDGHFTWKEWTEVFSTEIRSAQGGGETDFDNTYYLYWMNALEQLCEERSLVANSDLRQRKEEWRQAYLNTPHGKPIELSAALTRGH